MKKIIKIISSLAILASLFLIIMFRTVPVGSFWENYVLLYVPVETEDNIILSSLRDSGIKGVVSLSGQYLPLNVSENSLEYAMFKTNIDKKENEYISSRNSYFFDKSNNYRIYYIPREHKHNLEKCVSKLRDFNIACGLDSDSSYPFLFPLTVTLLVVAVCFFCKNKLLFILTSAIPIVYVFCNPFFPVALAICLLIFCAFFISNIWHRQGAVSYLNSFLFLPLCMVAGFLCGLSASLMSGLLYIAAAIGMLCVFSTYSLVQEIIRSRKSFVPVYIRPAKDVSIYSRNFRIVFTIILFGALLLFGIFAFTSSKTFYNKLPNVLLPSSVGGIESSELPQLKDYYKWTWNITTYPYKSLNSDDSSGDDYIYFPEYSSEDGTITVKDKIFIYDESFEQSVFDNIDNLKFNSIEKVMKSEGASFKGGYNSTCSYHIDLFGVIVIIMCYFILLFIYFSIIIKARKGAKHDIK